MKYVIGFVALILVSLNAAAQPPEYKDLQILYADGNYEKLVREGEKYAEKEKTKKDAYPYLWMAKGLYKISLSGTDDEKFKNAYKDAIKFLSKGFKNDLKYNEGAVLADEQKFISEFQMSLYEMVNNDLSSGGFKKAKSWALKYNKITSNQLGALYLMGACKYFDGDKPGARADWLEADKQLKEVESIASWSDADKAFLKAGVLYSAKALKQGRQEDKAKDLVGKVAQWFEDDPDWQNDYDDIVNGTE